MTVFPGGARAAVGASLDSFPAASLAASRSLGRDCRRKCARRRCWRSPGTGTPC